MLFRAVLSRVSGPEGLRGSECQVGLSITRRAPLVPTPPWTLECCLFRGCGDRARESSGFPLNLSPATKTSLHASAKLGVCPAACMCVLCIFRVPEGFKFGPSGFARHRIGSGIKRYRTLAAAAWLRLGECCYYRKTAAGCRATLAFCKVGVLRVTQ